jgi:hypothetical protein
MTAKPGDADEFREATPASNQREHSGRATDAIIGEVPGNERNDEDDADEANEPSGDPGKNVPSA